MTTYSDFRLLMDQWDEFSEAEDKINDLFGTNRLVVFFKKDDDFFGAPEESRIMFAKMKNNDDDISHVRDELQFLAMNLARSLEEPTRVIMNIEDIEDLKVVGRDEVIDALKKLLKKKKDK